MLIKIIQVLELIFESPTSNRYPSDSNIIQFPIHRVRKPKRSLRAQFGKTAQVIRLPPNNRTKIQTSG